MTPASVPHVNCYPDDNFAGLYSHKDSQDPHCANSCTGYITLLLGVLFSGAHIPDGDRPLHHGDRICCLPACKDLHPLVSLIRELSAAVGLDDSFISNIHCKVHEDNVGALTLARLEPRRMTPSSKHYAIKYHWFRDKVADPSQGITLVKIDTKNQLGDLFTKGLPQASFVHL